MGWLLPPVSGGGPVAPAAVVGSGDRISGAAAGTAPPAAVVTPAAQEGAAALMRPHVTHIMPMHAHIHRTQPMGRCRCAAPNAPRD